MKLKYKELNKRLDEFENIKNTVKRRGKIIIHS